MTQSEILSGLENVIQDMFGGSGAITPATTAADVEGWDSLSHLLLIAAVEKHFRIRLPRENLFDLDNVGELAALIGSITH